MKSKKQYCYTVTHSMSMVKNCFFGHSELNKFIKYVKFFYYRGTNHNSITVLRYFHKSFIYIKSVFFKLLLNCYTVMLGIFDYVMNKGLMEITRS